MTAYIIGFLMAVIVLALFILLISYVLFRYTFCYPEKNRPNPKNIPDSNLYKEYKNPMLETVNDIENTPSENVEVKSLEGYRLYGRLYKINDNAPTIIFFHGYHGVSSWDGYGIFKLCIENGINLLMADERAHGRSEGKTITLGIKERYDCKIWAEYAANRFGEKNDIILAGVSMGAASVIMSSELGLPVNIKAIIADCCFSKPSDIIKETVRKMNLPVKPVYSLIRLGAYIYGHFNLEEMSPLTAVKQLNIPVLFIYGSNDSIVPAAMSEELFKNCPAKKEKIIINNADHANSAMTDYKKYQKSIITFLRKYVSLP